MNLLFDEILKNKSFQEKEKKWANEDGALYFNFMGYRKIRNDWSFLTLFRWYSPSFRL